MATSYYVDAATGSDSNAGTSTGAAFLTIAHAFSVVAAGDTVYIKAGTYVQTATLNITVATLSIIGYGVTPGDNGTKPLITTATNSTVIFNTGTSNSGVQIFSNLSLSNTASTRASGIWQAGGGGTAQTWVFVNCVFDGFNRAIDNSNGTPYYVAYIHVVNCEIKNASGSVASGIDFGNSNGLCFRIVGCYFHNNLSHLTCQQNCNLSLEYCIFAGSTGPFGINLSGNSVSVDHCTFANNTNTSGSLVLATASGFTSITNNIFYGNTSGTGLVGTNSANPGVIAGAAAGHSNAFGNNGTNYSNWAGSPGDVTLSANPFTNAGSGDYSLNSTAGGGAACKGAGFPGGFLGGTTTGSASIGAVEPSAGGGGGGGGMIVNPGMSGGIRG